MLTAAGCEHTPRQLTDRDLDLMAATKISAAWIDLHDGSQISLDSSQLDQVNALLKLLGPIANGKIGVLNNSDYQLNFHSGMDPTNIRVRIDAEQLKFSLGGFVYSGSESAKFLECLTQLQ